MYRGLYVWLWGRLSAVLSSHIDIPEMRKYPVWYKIILWLGDNSVCNLFVILDRLLMSVFGSCRVSPVHYRPRPYASLAPRFIDTILSRTDWG